MKGILKSAKAQRKIIPFIILFLLSVLAFTLQPVVAQTPFDLNWTFDYSPLISAAPNSLHLRIHNTALAPVRLLSVGIRFPWMDADAYLSRSGPQIAVDISPQQEVTYTIPFQIPADVLTARYTMNTFLQYQVLQTTQYGGQEGIVYVLDVVVLGRSSPFSMTFDPYDGRFYSALALLTLIGWYLPKKLRPKAKG
jgi:hypothetical protein